MRNIIIPIIYALWCGLCAAVSYHIGYKQGKKWMRTRRDGWFRLYVPVRSYAGSCEGKRWYYDIGGIRLVVNPYDEVVGWYRPEVDPDVEELKVKLDTIKTQFEYVMEHPEDRCLFCEHRDEECGTYCDPKYIEGCDACG